MIKLGTKTRLILACALLTLVVSVFSVVAALAASNVSVRGSVSINYRLYTLMQGFGSNISSVVTDNNITEIVFDYIDQFPNDKTLSEYASINVEVGNGENIKAYYKSGDTTLYVLSSGAIKANLDSSYMFSDMNTLSSIQFNNFNTFGVSNMSYMFHGCSQLDGLEVSEWDTGNVDSMNSMFKGCAALTSLDVSNWDTGKVGDMYLMFHGCAGLTSLDVSNWDTKNVTTMAGMFNGCAALGTLDISNWNTSIVEEMYQMFLGCSGLSELDLSNFNTTSVENMNYMFAGCSGLTELDLSSFNTSKVTDMSFMFAWCGNLTRIYVDIDGWNLQDTATGIDMFVGCNNITGGGETTYSAENIEITFARVDLGPTSTAPGYLTAAYTLVNGSTFNNKIPSNTTSIIFEQVDSVATKPSSVNDYLDVAGKGYIWKYVNGTTLHIQSLKKIVANADCERMFYNKDQLQSIYFNNIDTRYVANMSSMFGNCWALTDLDISNFDTANVTNMRNMFYWCEMLSKLDLSNFNTANVLNMSAMFEYCYLLTTINVGAGWNTDRVTPNESMFSECNNLVGGMGTAYNASYIDKTYARIDGGASAPGYLTESYASLVDGETFNALIPADVTQIEFRKVASKLSTEITAVDVGSNGSIWYIIDGTTMYVESTGRIMANTSSNKMFYQKTALTTVIFNNFDTSNVTDMSYMFYECSALTELNLSHFNTGRVATMKAMFHSCSGLTELDVSSFNTSNVTNMWAMFYNCSLLRQINVYNFDTSNVGVNDTNYESMVSMFGGCSSLVYAQNEDDGFDLSKWDTSNVTNMWGMFADCSSLTKLNVTSFNTGRVGNMHKMFYNCSSLTSLDVTSFVTSQVGDISYMFAGCTNLGKNDTSTYGTDALNLTNFNTANVVDMQYMFNGCSNIKKLDLSSFTLEKAPHINRMFQGCGSLTRIYVSEAWSDWSTHSDNKNFTFNSCSKLVGQDGQGKTYAYLSCGGKYAKVDGGYFTLKT